jgi:hypothetical protein
LTVIPTILPEFTQSTLGSFVLAHLFLLVPPRTPHQEQQKTVAPQHFFGFSVLGVLGVLSTSIYLYILKLT